MINLTKNKSVTKAGWKVPKTIDAQVKGLVKVTFPISESNAK